MKKVENVEYGAKFIVKKRLDKVLNEINSIAGTKIDIRLYTRLQQLRTERTILENILRT